MKLKQSASGPRSLTGHKIGVMAMADSEYRYREGVHGEHCIDFGYFVFDRKETIGRAATKEDAVKIAAELNELAKVGER